MKSTRGFSLIELLIVMAIMAALSGGAMLRTEWVADHARTTALRHNLKVLRQALDDHHADRRRFPAKLSELVERRYLRDIPVDPTTGERETWVAVPSSARGTDVADVRSPTEGHQWY